MLDGAEQRQDGGVREGVLKGTLGSAEDRAEDALDSLADGTEWVGWLCVHGEGRALFDGTADVAQGKLAGVAGELPAAAVSGAGGDDAGFAQGSEETADDDGVGVDAAGDVLRGERLAGLGGEEGEDVECDGETGADVHL